MRPRWIVLALLLVPTVSAGADRPNWFDDLLTRIDPGSPAAAVVSKLDAGASARVKMHALAEAMRARESPAHLWVISLPEDSGEPVDMHKADDAVAHKIHSQYGSEQFGDTLPWFSPGKQVQTIARFPHFDWLAPAYALTGDERYALAMVRDMVDFARHAPLSRASWATPQTDPVINPWNWVLQHWRIMRWIDALVYLRDSPSLPDSTYLQLTLHLWKEVDWLLPRMELGLHNGTLGNIRAVLYASLHFPEARASTAWMAKATGMFRYFLDTYFYPGEVSVELTLGYSSAVLGECLKIYEDLPNPATKQSLAGPLQALVDGHLGLMKPDRSLPRYGDHGDYDFPASVLEHAATLFDREDWKAILLERGPKGGTLSYPARSMPYYLSGYYAMRDGWSRAAQYLSMDAGPFGTNHQHGDKLSITLSADGAAFIVDPGTSIYRTTEARILYDLRPGFLHNSITVNGADPSTGYDQHYQFDRLENRWITNPVYDFLDGVYDYRPAMIDVMARRNILYLRGDYWIMLDEIYGRRTARIERTLQCAPGIDLTLLGGSALARARNGAILQIASAPDTLSTAIVRGDTLFPGSTFPLRYGKNTAWKLGGRGWVGSFGNHAPDMSAVDAAPALLAGGDVALPYFVLTVFSPSLGQAARPRRIEEGGRRGEELAWRIVGSENQLIDHFQWHPGSMPATGARPQAEGGCWVQERDGKAVKIIIINSAQTELCEGDLMLRVRFSDRVDACARRERAGWRLQIDPASSASLRLIRFEVQDRGSPARVFVAPEDPTEWTPGTEGLLVEEH